MEQSTCSIDNCEKAAKTRGWCYMHYKRWRIHGDPLFSLYQNPDIPRPCPRCGSTDNPKTGESRHCQECWNAIRRERRLQNAGMRACLECGDSFPALGVRLTCGASCKEKRDRRLAGYGVERAPAHCRRCETTFVPSSGRHVFCSPDCLQKATDARRAQDAAYLESKRAYDRAHRQEHRQRYLRRSREWREQNRDRHREMSRNWYAKNTERAIAATRRWGLANPARLAESEQRRRAAKRGSSVLPVTVEALESKAATWGWSCWMCGSPYDTWDHVKPLAKGGAHMLSNMRPACRSCNSRKNAKWLGVKQLHIFKAA